MKPFRSVMLACVVLAWVANSAAAQEETTCDLEIQAKAAVDSAQTKLFAADDAYKASKQRYGELVQAQKDLKVEYDKISANLTEDRKGEYGALFGSMSAQMTGSKAILEMADANLLEAGKTYTKAFALYDDGFYAASIIASNSSMKKSLATKEAGTDGADQNHLVATAGAMEIVSMLLEDGAYE